ncbi:CLIP-associated protein-like isoform X2 [Panicum virgatum]|nr:CLIP-associated protein-like isoform X2 [Panicum virgatum]XP_039785920.1 CLIP-associated protein-like isoform X2 [Panicum virgatum]
MASSAAVARLRELTTAPARLRSPSAARSSCAPAAATPRPRTRVLEALCAAGGGDAMRSHADGLAPLVVARLGDGDAAVREAARRFLVVLMEAAHGDVSSNIYSCQAVPPLHHCHLPTTCYGASIGKYSKGWLGESCGAWSWITDELSGRW